MGDRLKGKVDIVTGGGSGIGEAICKKFAREGASVIVAGFPEDPVEAVAKEIQKEGGTALPFSADISTEANAKSCVETAVSQFGKLDILVNNAGMAPRQRNDILEATEENYDEVMNTNLKGSYFLMQKTANWMIEQKKKDNTFNGCIINISSMSATVASVNRGEYCLSKAGLSMATQLFAVRLGAFNIPVFEVRPGIILTDMTAGVKEKYDKMINEGLCVQQRWGEPEDVGKVVAALAKGDFMYSTGQVIMVDGGLTIPRL